MNTDTANLMSQVSTDVLTEAAARLMALTSPTVEENKALALTLGELMERSPEMRAAVMGAL